MCVLAVPAVAATIEVPLAFTETGKLAASCTELAAGVKLGIRNETATKQAVHLVLDEFTDSKTKKTVGLKRVCGGLEVEVPKNLAGGRSATAVLSATRPRKGEFTGSLSLFSTRDGVARREVSIPLTTAGESLAATPLVESEKVDLTGSARGPIWVPVEGSGEAAAESSASEAQEEPEPSLPVGAVAGPNGVAAVVYNHESESLGSSSEKLELELDSDGLDPGAYSGTVDLNPGDDEKGKVSLEVNVAASAWIAIGLLVAGILLALFLQRTSGRLLPRYRLRRRIDGLTKRHKELVKKLTAAAATAEEKDGGDQTETWGKFAIAAEDLESRQADLRGQRDETTKWVVIQIDKKVLESLEAAIAVVEAQVDLLKEIPVHAKDLEGELEKLPSKGGNGERPSLYAEARKALAGAAVRADQLKPRIEEIDARAKQVRTQLGLEDRLADLKKAREGRDSAQESKLKELDTKLSTIARLLWGAETAEDLSTAGTEIQAAAKLEAELWPELPQEHAEVLRHAFLARPPLARYAFAETPIELLSEEGASIEAMEVPPAAPLVAPRAPRDALPSPGAAARSRIGQERSDPRSDWPIPGVCRRLRVCRRVGASGALRAQRDLGIVLGPGRRGDLGARCAGQRHRAGGVPGRPRVPPDTAARVKPQPGLPTSMRAKAGCCRACASAARPAWTAACAAP